MSRFTEFPASPILCPAETHQYGDPSGEIATDHFVTLLDPPAPALTQWFSPVLNPVLPLEMYLELQASGAVGNRTVVVDVARGAVHQRFFINTGPTAGQLWTYTLSLNNDLAGTANLGQNTRAYLPEVYCDPVTIWTFTFPGGDSVNDFLDGRVRFLRWRPGA